VGGGRVMGIHGEFSGCLKMKFHQFIEMEQTIFGVIVDKNRIRESWQLSPHDEIC
jgi:hypothetical protein